MPRRAKIKRQTTRYRIFSPPARTIHKPLLSVTYCTGKQANKSEGGTSRMMTRKLFTLLSVPCSILRSCGCLKWEEYNPLKSGWRVEKAIVFRDSSAFYHPVKGVPEGMFKRGPFPTVEGSYGEWRSWN
ncbi:hypothetical protein CDAR_541391 [Caerostris darwini]|uniref:Uncharacterized protein n=1 Tax=Caerostris darwini TaxID=1538125 RepID=A0AAV4VXS3_9ARAC|nr:hypothetical protein CDAR_541391 [Caerostris darwini]